MKIAITGASGMLGTALLSELSSNQKIFATARSEGINNNNIIWRCFDLLDTARLKQWLFDVSPDVVIHCAAMVDVEKCESQVDIAYELHAHTTKIISSFLKSNFGYLIYISTDSVFDGLKENMTIAQEEIFGPVLGVLTVKNDEEALKVASNSKYGLHASVFTQDINRAFHLAKSLPCGTVSVNTFSEGDIKTPFGGYKQSGIGRDNGYQALENYLQVKSTWIKIT